MSMLVTENVKDNATLYVGEYDFVSHLHSLTDTQIDLLAEFLRLNYSTFQSLLIDPGSNTAKIAIDTGTVEQICYYIW